MPLNGVPRSIAPPVSGTKTYLIVPAASNCPPRTLGGGCRAVWRAQLLFYDQREGWQVHVLPAAAAAPVDNPGVLPGLD